MSHILNQNQPNSIKWLAKCSTCVPVNACSVLYARKPKIHFLPKYDPVNLHGRVGSLSQRHISTLLQYHPFCYFFLLDHKFFTGFHFIFSWNKTAKLGFRLENNEKKLFYIGQNKARGQMMVCNGIDIMELCKKFDF